MNKRNRKLVIFALVCFLFLIINMPDSLSAAGEYNGIWVGPETVTVPAYGVTITETTGTVFYQENDNALHFFDPLFGAVPLVKSGSKWILPSPIWTTFAGYQAYLTEVSITFHSSSFLTGSITVEILGVTGAGTLSHTKQSCQSLTNDSTVSGLSGGAESIRCYEIDLPSGATNLSVETWGGSGDCDLALIYSRPGFDFYFSENWHNSEQITLSTPNFGKWYILLGGFESYSGVNLSVSYIDVGIPAPSANFDAGPLEGRAPLTVNFTDQSTGSIASWEWDFGDGSTCTERNPSHTYTYPGIYTVSLTVTGPEGSDTETKTDCINVRPSAKTMPWIPLLLLCD